MKAKLKSYKEILKVFKNRGFKITKYDDGRECYSKGIARFGISFDYKKHAGKFFEIEEAYDDGIELYSISSKDREIDTLRVPRFVFDEFLKVTLDKVLDD